MARGCDFRAVSPFGDIGTAIVGLGMVATPAVADAQRWEPTSSTAAAITGAITLSDETLAFANRAKLRLELINRGKSGRFDFVRSDQTVKAAVFRVMTPSNPKLLNGNRACDGPVSYVVAYYPGPAELYLNLYSGRAEPSDASSSCGSFVYDR